MGLWHYNNLTNFHVNLVAETPLKGIERSEVAASVALLPKNSRGTVKIHLHPIDMEADASVKDNDLGIWIISRSKEARFERFYLFYPKLSINFATIHNFTYTESVTTN